MAGGRVAFVDKYTPARPVHGRASRMAGLARAAKTAGLAPTCLVLGPRAAVSSQDGVRVVEVPCPRNALAEATLGALRLRRALSRLEREAGPFDAVQMENPQLWLLARRLGRPFSFEAHVIEADYWASSSERGPVARLAGWLLRRAERWMFRNAARVLVLSRDDAARVAQIEPGAAGRVRVVPHCVEPAWLDAPAASPPTPGTALFLGAYTHPANREAVRFLVERVAPLLAREHPAARLVVAGSGLPRDLPVPANVTLVPDAPDAMRLVDAAEVCVAPVFQGSGVRTKLLEYMARGKCVVATRTATYGIAARDGEEILLAESAEAFALQVAAALRDPARAARVGAAARQAMRRDHDWTSHVAALPALLLPDAPAPARAVPAPLAATGEE